MIVVVDRDVGNATSHPRARHCPRGAASTPLCTLTHGNHGLPLARLPKEPGAAIAHEERFRRRPTTKPVHRGAVPHGLDSRRIGGVARFGRRLARAVPAADWCAQHRLRHRDARCHRRGRPGALFNSCWLTALAASSLIRARRLRRSTHASCGLAVPAAGQRYGRRSRAAASAANPRRLRRRRLPTRCRDRRRWPGILSEQLVPVPTLAVALGPAGRHRRADVVGSRRGGCSTAHCWRRTHGHRGSRRTRSPPRAIDHDHRTPRGGAARRRSGWEGSYVAVACSAGRHEPSPWSSRCPRAPMADGS